MSTQAPTRKAHSIPAPGLGHFRTALTAGFIFSAVVNLLMLSLPLYSLQVFTRAIPSANVDTLIMLTVVVVLALSITALLEIVRSRLFNRAGTYLDVAFRPRLLGESMEGGQRGRAASALLSDLGEVRSFLTRPQFTALLDLPWIPLYVAGIYLIHPLLAGLMVLGSVLLVGLALIGEAVTKGANEEAKQPGSRAQRLLETAMGRLDTVRALRMQDGVLGRWEQDALAAHAHGGTAYDRTVTVGAVTRWLRYLVQVAVTGVSAALVMENHLSFGGMIATSMLIARAMAPIDTISGGWTAAVRPLGAWRRVMPALKRLNLPARGAAAGCGNGLLSVENVLVLAGRDQKPILRSVGFELQAGELLCVFGPNRSGKSMLAKVLTGAVRPYAGSVRLDGVDIAEWHPGDSGGGIGYVPQNVELLPGTIAENIARFKDVDRDEVIQLARDIGLHDAIMALPQGYDTDAGEAAASGMLSGGTERLVALARAAFGQPRLLVLDEAISNLDVPGHECVRRFLAAARERGITTVVLSHQSMFLEMADKVMVLKDGTVTAYGPRDQVVRSATRRPVMAAAAQAD